MPEAILCRRQLLNYFLVFSLWLSLAKQREELGLPIPGPTK
jgi:hypothetical protein